MDFKTHKNKRSEYARGLGIACVNMILLFSIVGCGKPKGAANEKTNLEQRKIDRNVNILEVEKRGTVLETASGRTVNEVDEVLGEHISEKTLLDFFARISAKYYTREEFIHSREYEVQGKKAIVFFKEGKTCGWAQ